MTGHRQHAARLARAYQSMSLLLADARYHAALAKLGDPKVRARAKKQPADWLRAEKVRLPEGATVELRERWKVCICIDVEGTTPREVTRYCVCYDSEDGFETSASEWFR